MTDQDKAGSLLELWAREPERMVRSEFGVEPDEWQLEALRAVANPATRRLALKACKGPGKTAVLAWIILWFLAVHPYSKVGATSITGENLSTNLWPELSKWMNKSEFFRSAFVWTSTRISRRQSPENWFAVARTWPKKANPEQQSDALAGLHADSVLFVLDESGGIPQAVMVTAEAVLSTEHGLAKVVQAGNPTHVDGPLYRACTIDRELWYVITITGDPDNPKRSPRISLTWAKEQIQQYGRDNPWVKVNVLGEFPPASINALLGVEDVELAMRRHLQPDAYQWAQKRLGVDAARFGDDPWTIFPRQGLAAFRPIEMRQPRTTLVSARIAKAHRDWNPELVFIDDTGHWGHGVVDQLLAASLPIVPVIFSDPATSRRYKNRRAEMWIEMAEWVKRGGALPPIPQLVPELTTTTYMFIGGQFVLEDKDMVKKRLGRSPNYADALATTFAIPEMPGAVLEKIRGGRSAVRDADPFEQAHASALRDDDPFRGIQ